MARSELFIDASGACRGSAKLQVAGFQAPRLGSWLARAVQPIRQVRRGDPNMANVRRVCIAAVLAGVIGVVPAARAASYAGGSLIIPTQSSYQDYCGVASAYGLVYNVLRANDGLAATGKVRISVHWAYKGTKASPNRCVPTDIQKPPVYGSYTTLNPPPW